MRDTLTEGLRAGATDFFIRGNLNVQFKLDNATEDLHRLDRIKWDQIAKEKVRTRSLAKNCVGYLLTDFLHSFSDPVWLKAICSQAFLFLCVSACCALVCLWLVVVTFIVDCVFVFFVLVSWCSLWFEMFCCKFVK